MYLNIVNVIWIVDSNKFWSYDAHYFSTTLLMEREARKILTTTKAVCPTVRIIHWKLVGEL